MPLFANPHETTTDLDISSIAFWSRTFDEREETFAKLRAEHPVSWHPPMEDLDIPPEVHGQAGFWAVTRAEDITYVSKNHELFSSELGYTMLQPARPEQRIPAAFLDADPPRHTEFRRLLSRNFTPKAVARIAAKIEERAAVIVDRVVGAGQIDFVSEVSARLPLLTVADMLGVPEPLMEEFRVHGENLMALQDPATADSEEARMAVVANAFAFFAGLGREMIGARRKDPADDLMTSLALGTVDGKPLGDDEITMVMLLFSTAGNDTTKQTTTRTVMAFADHPEQRNWLLADFDGRIGGAIEEFVRYATPVMQFNRTATRDQEFHGQQILEGDKVGIFYCSGNRDERVFADPAKFDLSRTPNPHVSFGGGGLHYCLGNGVAKAQLRALFRNILVKLPKIEIGEPEYLTNNFINGVKRLPVTIG